MRMVADSSISMTGANRLDYCKVPIDLRCKNLRPVPHGFRNFTRMESMYSRCGHLTRSKMLKIGMYRATIMPPMIDPRTTIMRGSINDVSCSVVASTSWS